MTNAGLVSVKLIEILDISRGIVSTFHLFSSIHSNYLKNFTSIWLILSSCCEYLPFELETEVKNTSGNHPSIEVQNRHSSVATIFFIVCQNHVLGVPLSIFNQQLYHPDHTFYLFHQISAGSVLLTSDRVSQLKFKAELVLTRPGLRTSGYHVSVWTVSFYSYGEQLIEVKSLRFAEIFRDLTVDMNGTVLSVVSSLGVERSMKFTKDPSTGNYSLAGGFANKIFSTLQRKYNFAYDLQVFPNFKPVLGLLQSGEADYTMQCGMTPDRHKFVHYLPVPSFSSLVFFTKQPSHVIDWALIRKPFEPSLWSIVLLAAAGTVTVHLLVVRFLHLRQGGYYRSVGYVLRPLLEQGINDNYWMNFVTLEIVTVFWLFATIIVCTAYKAKLTMLRSHSPEEEVPNSYEELAHSDYGVYLHFLGGMFYKMLKSARNPVIQKISERLQPEKSLENCLNFVLKEKSACIAMDSNGAFKGYGYFSDPNGQLLIRKSVDRSFQALGAPAVRKNALFATGFAKTVRILLDMGLVVKFQQEEDRMEKTQGKLRGKNVEQIERLGLTRDDGDGPKAITLEEFLVLIFIIAFLAVSSALILLVELMVFKSARSLSLKYESDEKLV